MRESKYFHTRFFLVFQNDSAKIKIFDEVDNTWDEVCCETLAFATCHSRLTMSVVLTNQNLKRVCVFMSRKRNQKPPLGLFVLFLLPPTVQLEVVSQHHELRHKQHTNSCKQHVHNLRVLVLLYSWDSSGSFQMWGFPLLGILLLRFTFRRLHEIPELVRCHHQWVLHHDSELSLDLRAGSNRNLNCGFLDRLE